MSYLDSIIEEMLLQQKSSNFTNLDKILKDMKVPLVVSEIIYEYAKPHCPECSSCCSVCKLYCYSECLRLDRDVCCKYELGQQLQRYRKVELVIDTSQSD